MTFEAIMNHIGLERRTGLGAVRISALKNKIQSTYPLYGAGQLPSQEQPHRMWVEGKYQDPHAEVHFSASFGAENCVFVQTAPMKQQGEAYLMVHDPLKQGREQENYIHIDFNQQSEGFKEESNTIGIRKLSTAEIRKLLSLMNKMTHDSTVIDEPSYFDSDTLPAEVSYFASLAIDAFRSGYKYIQYSNWLHRIHNKSIHGLESDFSI